MWVKRSTIRNKCNPKATPQRVALFCCSNRLKRYRLRLVDAFSWRLCNGMRAMGNHNGRNIRPASFV